MRKHPRRNLAAGPIICDDASQEGVAAIAYVVPVSPRALHSR
jgi:hypothetical protein